MSKELLEDLLIEFDEMGFEPTTLCDTEEEIDSFRRRLKQVLDYLKSISKKEQVFDYLIKHKKYDADKMKFTFEIEADDFKSSEGWNDFKEMLKNE